MSRRVLRLLIGLIYFNFVIRLLLTGEAEAKVDRQDELSLSSFGGRIDTAAFRNALLSEGIPEGAVATLLKQHEWLQQQGRQPRLQAVQKNRLASNSTCTTCQGIGAESGWSNWQSFPGYNDQTGLSFGPQAFPMSPRFDITSGNGIDPLTPGNNPGDPVIPVVAPGFGTKSIRLGEPNTAGYGAERLVFPFTVGINDTSFIYSYAFVMENPSNITPAHTDVNMPYVEFMILDDNGDTVDCAYRRYQANETFPGQYSCNGPGQFGSSIIPLYKPWTNVGVNLSAYIGRNLTVVITNADCQLGGHFAYSYWDFSCGALPSLVRPNCAPGVPDTLMAPASEPNNPYTYRWFQNQSPNAVGTSQTLVTLSSPGDTFKVEITTAEGCRWYMFYVPQPFNITADFNFQAVCGDVNFTDLSLVPSGADPVSDWSWYFGGAAIPSQNGQDPGTVHLPPGSHAVSLVVTTATGCRDSVSKTVFVPDPPTAAITTTNVCLGDSTRLVSRSIAFAGDPIVGHSWMVPGGVPASGNNPSVSTLYASSGIHDLSLVVSSASGCRDTVDGQCIVYRLPEPELSGAGEACVPYCSRFVDRSRSQDGRIVSWQWRFAGGTPSSWQGAQPGEICYVNPGDYEVKLRVMSELGCEQEGVFPSAFIGHEAPAGDFSIEPATAQNAQPVFDFFDHSTSNVVRWTWDFGDGTPMDDSGPVVHHNYSASVQDNDFYQFESRLYVTTRYGCTDTVVRKVEINPDFSFFLPNAFTPDDKDGLNPTFFGKGRGIKEYEFFVFDRWGLEIWSCNAAGDNVQYDRQDSEGLPSRCAWNGYYEGSRVQQDVYVWLVRLVDVYGRRHSYTGRVSVVY